jgi:hypothetical protein
MNDKAETLSGKPVSDERTIRGDERLRGRMKDRLFAGSAVE